jgi:branched-chain amino acid transport system permease protein
VLVVPIAPLLPRVVFQPMRCVGAGAVDVRCASLPAVGLGLLFFGPRARAPPVAGGTLQLRGFSMSGQTV